jgi:glycosyltransferase involved in cell wall biosynthesis
MPKIKVAFFAEILIEDFDGASRTMFQLIRRIPAEQFEFLFIAGMGPTDIFGFECLLLPTVTIPINRTYKMAVPQLAKRRLRAKLGAFQPDIVHIATPSMLGEYALKYGNEQHLPIISIYHTHFISYIDYYLRKLPFLIKPVKKQIEKGQKRFYNQVDLIYVPAESIAADMQSIGIQGERMKIWKRGMDTQLFSPAKRDVAFMERITGNQLPTVIFASRFVWEKNLETLIRIYQLAQSQSIPCNFLMVGDGVARADCEAAMPGAIFYGNVDHESLSVLYASSDLFLFPSISESYGNVVLEAMASGLPCVLADGGGSRDFVEQGVTGFKCSPDDETEYVAKILLLLQDVTLRKHFSEAGRKYSLGFDWQQLADTYFADLQVLSKRS